MVLIGVGNVGNQNKMLTIYRALNVECTEVNVKLQQPVWLFCLEKDFSALLGYLQQTGQKSLCYFLLYSSVLFS